ncbi:MAG: glycerophosphoryl diester phosphodiesterase membrane domain-containing protein [Candidatus Nanopelagicales bacterium]|nr:glycerophosphoryl diester phosphodiesterase membrane domain-containing protein [Candidatus Nanopelagicales bacterium]
MSSQPPPPGQPDPGHWAPPSGWSPEQPAAWPSQPAPPSGYGQVPPPGYGQVPPPGYGQPGPPGYGQPGPPLYGQPGPPLYGQVPPPGYGQPGPPMWGQPTPWGPPPPAPKPGIVPLRPLGVGELLDGALSLIRSNPRTVLGLAAAISAVSALLQTVGLWISLQFIEGAQPVAGSAEVEIAAELTALASGGLAQLVPALVAGFLQVLASGLFIVLVGAAVLGRQLDAGQTWTSLRPRMLPLVGVTLLIGLGSILAVVGMAGAIVALAFAIGEWAVLPGLVIGVGGTIAIVYVYVKLSVASPALVMEGVGVVGSLKRSWVLVRRSWWRVLGILVLAAIITSLLTTVVTIPITLIATLVSGFSESLIPTVLASGVATLVAGIITLPFSAAVTGLLYIDLRMRREALDIELVSAGITPSEDPLAAYRTHQP